MSSFWDDLGVVLGLFCGHVGVMSGSFWGHFGVMLGSLWDHFGVMLGSLWGHFGITLGSLEIGPGGGVTLLTAAAILESRLGGVNPPQQQRPFWALGG